MAKNILIIEDEKTLARALELKLTRSGFEVKTVFNGEDGLASLEKEEFSLILLDLIMPKMDGFTVLAILKEMKIKSPVVVLSNLSQKEDEKYAKDFGAKDFFIKSNTPIETIVARVEELLK